MNEPKPTLNQDQLLQLGAMIAAEFVDKLPEKYEFSTTKGIVEQSVSPSVSGYINALERLSVAKALKDAQSLVGVTVLEMLERFKSEDVFVLVVDTLNGFSISTLEPFGRVCEDGDDHLEQWLQDCNFGVTLATAFDAPPNVGVFTLNIERADYASYQLSDGKSKSGLQVFRTLDAVGLPF